MEKTQAVESTPEEPSLPETRSRTRSGGTSIQKGSTRPPRIGLIKRKDKPYRTRKVDDQGHDGDDDQNDDEDGNKKRKRMKPSDARVLRVQEGRRKHGPNYVMPSWLDGLSSSQKLRRSYVHDHLPSIPVLSSWETRAETYECCVHRDNSRTVAGGSTQGAYSVLLGSYNSEGVDWGESFTMNGEGGRAGIEEVPGKRDAFNILSKDTFSQDQKWARGNLALKRNMEKGLPLRVIRSVDGKSPYRPSRGFRYDGLYRVTDYEELTSSNGFSFILFSFDRLPGQPPIPRNLDDDDEDDEDEDDEDGDEDDGEGRN